METTNKFQSFTDVTTWKEGHKLVLAVYKATDLFPSISHGSLTELQNQLLIARNVGCLSSKDFQDIASQTVSVAKLLNGLKSQNLYQIRNIKYKIHREGGPYD